MSASTTRATALAAATSKLEGSSLQQEIDDQIAAARDEAKRRTAWLDIGADDQDAVQLYYRNQGYRVTLREGKLRVAW